MFPTLLYKLLAGLLRYIIVVDKGESDKVHLIDGLEGAHLAFFLHDVRLNSLHCEQFLFSGALRIFIFVILLKNQPYLIYLPRRDSLVIVFF